MFVIDSINAEILSNALKVDKNGNFQKVSEKINRIPTVLDKETLNKLQEGEYGITLEKYTSLNNYKVAMSSWLGDSSNNQLVSSLNTLLSKKENNLDNQSFSTVKDFLEKMQERGLSKEDALKLYSTAKSYSLTNSFLQKNNFLSAKI